MNGSTTYLRGSRGLVYMLLLVLSGWSVEALGEGLFLPGMTGIETQPPAALPLTPRAPLSPPLPLPEDLLEAPGVSLDASIQTQAEALHGNPLEIYRWVRDQIAFIPTAGLTRGAQLTLSTREGNAADIASLLIALLRASEIPARYVSGAVRVPTPALLDWLGVADGHAALSLLAQGGIAHQAEYSGGQLSGVLIAHIWVEAWVAVAPERGSSQRAGDAWLSLDASAKPLIRDLGTLQAGWSEQPGSDLADSLPGFTQTDVGGAWRGVLDPATLDTAMDSVLDDLRVYSGTDLLDLLGELSILPESRPVLPVGLPFHPLQRHWVAAALPVEERQRIMVQLIPRTGAPEALEVELYTLLSEPLELRFSSDDPAVVAEISERALLAEPLPAHRLTVWAELWQGELRHTRLGPLHLGEALSLRVQRVLGERTQLDRLLELRAGEHRLLGWFSGNVSEGLLLSLASELRASPVNLATLFQGVAQTFSTALNIHADWQSGAVAGRDLADLQGIILGPRLRVQELDGVAHSVTPGGLALELLQRPLLAATGGGDTPRLVWQLGQPTARLAADTLSLLDSSVVLDPVLALTAGLEDDPSRVFWLDASTRETLLAGLTEVPGLVALLDQAVTIGWQGSVSAPWDNDGQATYGVMLHDPLSGNNAQWLQAPGMAPASALATGANPAWLLGRIAPTQVVQDYLDAMGVSVAAALEDLGGVNAAPRRVSPGEPLWRLLATSMLDLQAGPQLPALLADGLWQALMGDGPRLAALRDLYPPTLELVLSATTLALGDTLSITVNASDDRGEVSVTVSLDGVALDGSNDYTWSPGRAGEYHLLVEAQDAAGNRVSEEHLISVTAPGDLDAPQLALEAFADPVTAPLEINATVEDANLLGWQLLLIPLGGGEPSILASGTDPQSGALASLDTTLLRNGLYRLQLSAGDANGLESSVSSDVTVDGRLKLGDFSFAVVDLSIPMVGLPIQVARAYDTRQRDQALDFGQGWSAVHQAVTVAESRTPGVGWQLAEYQTGPLNAVTRFCVEPLDRPQVVITLPDESLARFAIEASPACQDLIPALDVALSFRPLGDTDATLAEVDAVPLRYQDGTLVDPGSGSPGDPDVYRLTTRAGYEYVLDQYFGIQAIVDPNGNRLRFDENGIHHDDGRSILYERDVSGRITAVVDPLERRHRYSHDENGDLLAVTDPLGQTTRYDYDDDHRLLAIIDPDGTRRVQNQFDAEGRLSARTGPLDDTTRFAHDIPARQSRVLDALGRETLYRYDDEGKLLSRIDPLGGEELHSYDANGYLASVTDPAGNVTRFEHNEAGDILAVTDPLGDTTRYEYHPSGRLLALVDARGSRFEIGRDARGNPVSFSDPLGNTATQTLDIRGRLVARSDYLGNSYQYQYNSQGDLRAEIDPLGNRTEYTLDDLGNVLATTRYRSVDGVLQAETTEFELDALDRVVSVVDPLGQRQRYEFDAMGEDKAYVSPLGLRTSFEVDGYGELTRTIFPDGAEQTREYDAVGNLLSVTDRAGRVTRYEYDALNRLIAETAPDAALTRHEYDLAGQLVATIDPLGQRHEFAHDAAGQRIMERDASGVELYTAYDAAGNPVRISDAAGNTIEHFYDAADRLLRTVYPDGSEIRQAYNANGRLISRHAAGGERSDYGYDALNRLVSITDALGQVTRHEYDELGNRIAQIDANGNTTRWRYDPRGRPLSRVLPGGAEERFIYDEGGFLLRHHTFGGATISYSRNLMDLVVGIHDGNEAIAIDYDRRGRRTRVRDHRGETRYAYDNRDRPLEVLHPDGSQVAYRYDLAGRRSGVGFTPVDGVTRWQDYQYDPAGRLLSVSDWQGRVTSFGYDSLGNREEIRYPNGVSTRFSHDSLRRPQRVETLLSDGTLLSALDYTHTANGQRATLSELDGWYSEYQYDALHRLVQASATAPDGTPYVERYVYDPVGNRLEAEQDGVLTAYQYDANDQLTRAGGEQYRYDPAGNLIRSEQGAHRVEYQYDPWNRLRLMEQYLGNTLVKHAEYDYDLDGMRTAARVDGVSRHFLLDSARPHAQLLAELDTAGEVAAAYVGADSIIARHAGSESRYLHADALGSTRMLTDAAGMEVTRYRYDAFGNPLSGAVAENPFLFAGEQYDSDLDMYYLRARYYQPGSGRLSAMDPLDGVLQRPMSQHKYLYALNDPVNAVDPSGMFSLAEMNISNDIRAELSNELIDASMGVLDAVFSNEIAGIAAPQAGAMALVAMAGQNAMMLRNLFSRRARTSCGINRNSFPAGTLVLTEAGQRPIEELAIGERVLAYDETSEESHYREILHLIRNQAEYAFVVLTLEDGSLLEATDGHPLYVVDTGWVEAASLSAGERLRGADGEELRILEVSRATRQALVYNLSVAEDPTYFVGESAVLVHNARCRQQVKRRNFNMVIIGRNMEGRVKPFARFFGAFWYQPRPPVPAPPPTPVLPSMDQNRRWIRTQMKRQHTIFDVGPGGPVGYSAYYEMEMNEIKHYRGRSSRRRDSNGQVSFTGYRGGYLYPRYRPVHFDGLFCDTSWTMKTEGGGYNSGAFCKQ